jgi:competence protein ComEA
MMWKSRNEGGAVQLARRPWVRAVAWGVWWICVSLLAVAPPARAEASKPFGESVRAKKKNKAKGLEAHEPRIDLNLAGEDDLVRLPGVGRKRAAQIIALRTKRPFRRVTELRRVRGIGKKTLRRILPFVVVGKVKVQRASVKRR